MVGYPPTPSPCQLPSRNANCCTSSGSSGAREAWVTPPRLTPAVALDGLDDMRHIGILGQQVGDGHDGQCHPADGDVDRGRKLLDELDHHVAPADVPGPTLDRFLAHHAQLVQVDVAEEHAYLEE